MNIPYLNRIYGVEQSRICGNSPDFQQCSSGSKTRNIITATDFLVFDAMITHPYDIDRRLIKQNNSPIMLWE